MYRDEHIIRRNAISKQMDNGDILILFAGNSIRKTADESYPFFANRNFLYLTGTKQEGTALVITKQNDSITETIYSRMPDEALEIWSGRRLREEEIVTKSGVENIADIKKLDMVVHGYLTNGKYNTLWLCIDTLEPNQKTDLEHAYAARIRLMYPEVQIKNLYPLVCSMRRYKSEAELEAIRKAMTITNKGIRRMMKVVRPGMMEYELEAEFDYELKMHGQRSTAFPSIIAYGERNFYLHYPLPMSRIDDGGLVLTDVGSPYDDYCTDISRVFPSSGHFSKKQAAIYNIAYEANREIMRQIRPGKPFTITNEVCRKVSFEGLKKLGLIDDISDIGLYVWHGVTHHVGLDTHDVGGYEDNMAENMVFTVDAGIYVREWGIGLRIEDNILVTADGCENLSGDIPVTIEEIEDIMRKRV